MASSFEFSVKHQLNESVLVHLNHVESEIIKQIRDIVRNSAEQVQKDSMDDMKFGKKTGRIYRYRGKPHQASAKGESPAVRSGTLYNSIKVQIFSGGLMASIYSETPYAKYLKKDRPILEPSFEKAADNFVDKIMDLMKGVGL